MEITKIKLNELEPATYNPRFINSDEYKQLKENLHEFGLVDPIIINLKNMRIIGGHQRYKVLTNENPNKEYSLIKLGDIGWVFEETELKIDNDDCEKALNISLNKLKGNWNLNKLSLLLDDINNSSFDTVLTGFTPSEIELINGTDPDEIIFEQRLFEWGDYDDGDYVIVKCPKCNHEFYEE